MAAKIMLADDEELIRILVSATLGIDGSLYIMEATDGEQALEMARREQPDLLLLDIRMPKWDGFQVCRALKQDPLTAHIKVVMLTAMAQEQDKRRGKEAGADDYITKPFSPTQLLDKVYQWLEGTHRKAPVGMRAEETI